MKNQLVLTLSMALMLTAIAAPPHSSSGSGSTAVRSTGAVSRTAPRARSVNVTARSSTVQQQRPQQLQKKSMQHQHINKWQKDWDTFKKHHHFGKFNTRRFNRWAIWSPWLLFPFGSYAYWWKNYTPC